MRKANTKKLTINRQTIRHLTSDEVGRINGGRVWLCTQRATVCSTQPTDPLDPLGEHCYTTDC